MNGTMKYVFLLAAITCAAIAPVAQGAQTIDKATITVYIDARKATGHPWHGPGDLIISAPLKHVPTPITKLPEAPGAVLCVVKMDESIACPGVRSEEGTEEGGSVKTPVTRAELPDANEQFYKQLQTHDARGAPTRAYRDASVRLFGRVVEPDTFCDPPQCPGDRRFVTQTIERLRAATVPTPQASTADASNSSGPTPPSSEATPARKPLLSPCPSSYDCEFFDIELPRDEVFGLVFIDPAMVFTNLVDGVIITRVPITRGDARIKRIDEILRRAATTLAPPGPWEAKRRLRAFSIRGIEDCVAAKCRATQSDFKLEPEETK